MAFVLSKNFVTVADTKHTQAAINIPLILLLDTFYFSLNNLRKSLPIALSLLILLSLIPYAHAQNNLTGSQMRQAKSKVKKGATKTRIEAKKITKKAKTQMNKKKRRIEFSPILT